MKKKIFCLFLTLMLLASFFSPCISVFALRFNGDISGDKLVTAVDYLTLKRYCLGTYDLSPSALGAADIDGNGFINASDYLMVKRNVLGTFSISNPAFYSPVSNGKSYTVSKSAASNYPDTYSCQLTDGVRSASASYQANEFCGFNSDVEIVVDLKSEGKKLNRFEVCYLSTTTAGIAPPASVSVFGSADGAAWSSIAKMTMPLYAEGTLQTAYFVPSFELEYRFIKFSVVKSSAWVFLDEVTVYSNVPDYTVYPADKAFEAYRADKISDAQRSVNIISLSDGTAYDSKLGKTAVSTGCSYTVQCNGYDSRAVGTDGMLTDGAATGAYFESGSFVGIDARGGITVLADLAQVRGNICGFSLHCFSRPTSDIELPAYVDILAGEDSDSLVNIARSYTTCGSETNFEFFVTLPYVINTRYVAFYIPVGEFYCWIEELEVFENSGSQPLQSYVYGTPDIPVVETDVYHSSLDSDYNTHQNLILGKSQQIQSDAPLDFEYYGESNTPQTSTLLTDGAVTENTYCYSGDWFHFSHGGGRSIFYDLGALSSVDSYSLRALVNGDWGIALPQKVSLVLSQNGADWYVADLFYPETLYDTQIVVLERELDKAYKARFAMLYISVGAHIFLDELTVNGTKNCDPATSLSDSSFEKTDPIIKETNLGYMAPDPEILGGVNDVNLVYHTGAVANEEFLLPYVAYLDKDGNILDTMFDGFLFLPTTGALPSGGRPYGTNIKSDWDYLYNDIFASDRCFEALENVAETVKAQLGLTELKLKVFVAIPHMDTTLADFGDVDGDGISEDLTELDVRVKVAEWYSEKVRAEFDSRGFQNLELHGFYWFHEAIGESDAETARRVSASLAEKGEQIFWIPYFQATGFSDWESFGFSTGCLQPNYAFNLDVPVSRLFYASEYAKKYGMSIELELDGRAFSDDAFFQKYMDYLRYGVEYGYMDDCIHMYYQGVAYFRTACYSDGKHRLIYDYTYQFIKGTLEIAVADVREQQFVVQSQKIFFGDLNSDGHENVTYRLAKSPSHGTVSVSPNGEFEYYPNKGFAGEDSFCFVVSDFLGTSDECKVTLSVG